MVNIHFAQHIPAQEIPTLIDSKKIVHAAATALKHLELDPEVDLSIVITDDVGIQDYNRQYRKINKVTDVLSFPGGEVDPDTGSLYLGDIIISYERARSQAETGQHTLDAEIQLLVVHGVLHLQGLNHLKNDQAEQFNTLQSDILADLGLDFPSTGRDLT